MCNKYQKRMHVLLGENIFIVVHVIVRIRMHKIKLKFSDRYAWANSADPDQTGPTGAV